MTAVLAQVHKATSAVAQDDRRVRAAAGDGHCCAVLAGGNPRRPSVAHEAELAEEPPELVRVHPAATGGQPTGSAKDVNCRGR